MTIQYLNKVKAMNSAIRDFNESNPPSETSSPEHWHTIKKFVDGLIRTPIYNSILDWPSKVEMTNLWLVIRDPCYT